MITSHVPTDWQDLEACVAEILRKSGLTVTPHKVVQGRRGKVEVDVYAEQKNGNRTIIFHYECKHWKSRVPQSVVHAFRASLDDCGANVGYIVSLAGFQKGAFEVAASTPVKLVEWTEFQKDFETDYYENYFRKALRECVEPLPSYIEPISPATFVAGGRLDEAKIDQFLQIRAKYEEFGFLCLSQYPEISRFNSRAPLKLPLRLSLSQEVIAALPTELIDVADFERFLALAKKITSEALSGFRNLLRAKDGVS